MKGVAWNGLVRNVSVIIVLRVANRFSEGHNVVGPVKNQ